MSEALEAGLERTMVARLETFGVWTLKHGKQGWPDRQVFIAPSRHVWFEFKRARVGRLTRAQKRRIPWLEARGERVYFITNLEQGLSIMEYERRRV